MAKVIEEFDAISVKNTSVQFHDDEEESTRIGCVGSVAGETEMRELVKRCEGVEVRKRTRPEKMNLTLSAHVLISVLRKIFGMSDENLKPGIYKYSTTAKGKEFTLTADVIDEFEDVTKLIAFPHCISATGFQFTVENGADEVAELELEFTVYPNDENDFYYEALVPELEDDEVYEKWHTNFNYELVELTTP